MTPDVKGAPAGRRAYRSDRRAATAAATRHAVLEAAREAFVERGYAATTVGEIARRAGVHVDTLYRVVGRKAEILRELVETAISGEDHAVTALDRPYVQAVQQAATASDKLRRYAEGVVAMSPRTVPIFAVLREAARQDPTCHALYDEVSRRRATNLRLLAAELRATGTLRPDLSDTEVADIVWSLGGPEHYAMLVGERGWTVERFAAHLHDSWVRVLLVDVETTKER